MLTRGNTSVNLFTRCKGATPNRKGTNQMTYPINHIGDANETIKRQRETIKRLEAELGSRSAIDDANQWTEEGLFQEEECGNHRDIKKRIMRKHTRLLSESAYKILRGVDVDWKD